MSDFTVIDIETTGDLPWRDKLVAVGIGERVHRPATGRGLAAMLLARAATVVAHTNYDLRWLLLDGLRLGDGLEYHDTKVMAWMLDGEQPLDLETLATKYLGRTPPKVLKIVQGVVMFNSPSLGLVPIEEAPWDEMEWYNGSDLETTAELYEVLREELERVGSWEHFVAEEAPFSRLLIEMEAAGVPYDSRAGARFLRDTTGDRELLRERLVEGTGIPDFNPGSGDQVASFLYGEVIERVVTFEIPKLTGLPAHVKAQVIASLTPPGVTVTKISTSRVTGTLTCTGRGLKPPKRKKGQAQSRPTVSTKSLNMLYGDDPWVANYVEWTRLTKLLGYLKDWQEREHDGRLHGRVDQAGTVTGRLAMREPNMQQVAGAVRTLFAGDLVIGDYGGLEARLAAHLSGDELMVDIFCSGRDLYGVMAARAWGGPESKENNGRGLMKLLWLASQYGAQGDTLANTLALSGMRGYTARKADALLNDLENAVPRLFEWRQEVIEETRSTGYVETLAGRRRPLPNIHSDEWKVMARAERQAVSTMVQGSAADVVRLAMLRCRQAFDPAECTILLQVHDEILWERGLEWVNADLGMLQSICENAYHLEVPLVFEIGEAASWGDKGDTNTQALAAAVAALEV